MTTFAIFRPFPRLLKFTLLWSMVLQTKCRTPWMFGSSTFQQLSLKFVCKNGGNLTDLIAIYLWVIKITSLFAGIRHYTQHSDVEAVSWIELSLYFNRMIYYDNTCYLYSNYLFIYNCFSKFDLKTWMAYQGDYPSSWQVKVSSEVLFSENDGLTFETNFSVCKVWGIFILITRVPMKIKGKLF